MLGMVEAKRQEFSAELVTKLVAEAKAKGDDWLADRIYSGVPAEMVGRKQEIAIGPMSGLSNVQYWLRDKQLEVDPAVCEAILKHAKMGDHLLSEDEVLAVRDRVLRGLPGG